MNNKETDKIYNQLQSQFLELENCEKVARHLYKDNPFYDNIVDIEYMKTEFENIDNWSVVLSDIKHDLWKCTCDKLNKYECSLLENCYLNGDNTEYNLNNIYIHIQPNITDNYQQILKKIKKQMEITKLKLINKMQKDLEFYESNCYNDISEIEINHIKKSQYAYKGIYVLLINDFNIDSITKEQFIKIFENENIKVIIATDFFI